jgi:hypothetical protein
VVLELLAHHQLVLVDRPGAKPGDVGGADVDEAVEVLGRLAQLEHVPGPVDVHRLRDRERYRQVVDRGEVKDPRRLAGQSPVLLLPQPQARLGDVGGDQLDPLRIDPRRDLARRLEHPLLDQRHDPLVGVARDQPRHQAPADEAGEPCHHRNRQTAALRFEEHRP